MYPRKASRNLVYGLMFLFISISQQSYTSLFQSQETRWSIPQNIPLYSLDLLPPILIADQNRTVHAFSSQLRGSSRVIVYNKWIYQLGWTSPTDIIIFPTGEARLTDVHLDRNGMFHLLFWGGDNTGAGIYYLKASSVAGDDANAWSPPFLIGNNAGDPEGAVFAEDEHGTLSVIYNGREFGNSIYFVQSKDGGESWTDPTPIFFASADAPNIAQLRLLAGRSGELHALWGAYTTTAQGRGIFYAQSQDGIEWSEPVLLADAQDGLGTQRPAIIEHNDTLLVVYNLSLKIMMRRSYDQGATWDDPSLAFPRHVGVNGDVSLVIDSNNDLHLFFGQRITGTPDIHGMWHSILVDNRWLEPEAVVKGPLIRDQVTKKGFDPFFARAVVTQGNVILVTWRTDPAAGANGIWYSFKKLDAPELPVVALTSAVSLPQDPSVAPELPAESTAIAPTPTLSMAIHSPMERPILQNNPALPILIGSISAGVIILLVVLTRGTNRKR